MIITIDGPTASGKSTAACLLAQRLDYDYLNTGLLFRALAYLLLTHEGYSEQQIRNPKEADIKKYLDPKRLEYKCDASKCGQVLFDGVPIKQNLKTSTIDRMASLVSTNPMVRTCIEEIERSFARDNNIVIDGRDTGSKVFPYADFKFFLEASVEVRAKRWQASQQKKGNTVSLAQAIESITERDKRDSDRAIAPLVVPKGAFVIDNSTLNQEETLKKLLNVIKK